MTTSVALCTYNGASYIEEQIQSILNQTIPVDEIVVCDDLSDDNTINIINRIKESNSLNIRIFINNKRLGFVDNFKKAINLCNNDLIMLCDQDDIWLPDKVSQILDYFDSNMNINTLFTNAILIDGNGNPFDNRITLWDYYFDEADRKRCELGMMVEVFCAGNRATGATMAFKKELLAELDFSSHKDFWHDELIAMTAVANHTLGYINKCLIKYRIHKDQTAGIGGKTPSIVIKGNYKVPELCLPKCVSVLKDEKDKERCDFINTRFNTKYHIYGFIEIPMRTIQYVSFYGKYAIAFILYDIKTSVLHTISRFIKKLAFPIKCFYKQLFLKA